MSAQLLAGALACAAVPLILGGVVFDVDELIIAAGVILGGAAGLIGGAILA